MKPVRHEQKTQPLMEEDSSCTLEDKFNSLRTAEEFLIMGWTENYDEARLARLQRSLAPVTAWAKGQERAYDDYKKTLDSVDRLIREHLARQKTETAPVKREETPAPAPAEIDPIYSNYFAMRTALDRQYEEARQRMKRLERIVTTVLSSQLSALPTLSLPTARTGLCEEDLIHTVNDLRENGQLSEGNLSVLFQSNLASLIESFQNEQKTFDEHKAAIDTVELHLQEALKY